MSNQGNTKNRKRVNRGTNGSKNNNNGHLRIYCEDIYGVNWSGVKVLQVEDDENLYTVKLADMIFAEGTQEACQEYLVFCTGVNRFKIILDDKTKNHNELWRFPEVRELAKSIAKLSKSIRIEDSLDTIRKAHQMVRGLRKAYYEKQEKERQQEEKGRQKQLARQGTIRLAQEAEERRQEQLRRERERVETETTELIAEITERLIDGEHFSEVADLVILVNWNIGHYGLNLRKELKNIENIALIGPAYGRDKTADAVEETVESGQLVAVA